MCLCRVTAPTRLPHQPSWLSLRFPAGVFSVVTSCTSSKLQHASHVGVLNQKVSWGFRQGCLMGGRKYGGLELSPPHHKKYLRLFTYPDVRSFELSLLIIQTQASGSSLSCGRNEPNKFWNSLSYCHSLPNRLFIQKLCFLEQWYDRHDFGKCHRCHDS